MHGYEISADPARLDHEVIHRWLSEESYWARGRPRSLMDKAIDASTCFGAYGPDGAQAGFARVVTDGATFAWLCDVFVMPEHRSRGLGVALVQAALDHPPLRSVRQWHLATLDAHGLYRRFGFASDPDKVLVLRREMPPAEA